MGKHQTIELKKEIVNKYLNNEGTLRTLEKEYGISYKTIFRWIKFNREGCDIYTRKKGSGRSKEEDIDYKERYEILKKYQAFLKAQQERK